MGTQLYKLLDKSVYIYYWLADEQNNRLTKEETTYT